MATEDTGSGTGSVQDPGSNNKSGDEASSLAARRARLRGTLAKQAAPPDPYVPDPYLTAQSKLAGANQPPASSNGDEPSAASQPSAALAASTDENGSTPAPPAPAFKTPSTPESEVPGERLPLKRLTATGEMPVFQVNSGQVNPGNGQGAPNFYSAAEPKPHPSEPWEDPEPVHQGEGNHQPFTSFPPAGVQTEGSAQPLIQPVIQPVSKSTFSQFLDPENTTASTSEPAAPTLASAAFFAPGGSRPAAPPRSSPFVAAEPASAAPLSSSPFVASEPAAAAPLSSSPFAPIEPEASAPLSSSPFAPIEPEASAPLSSSPFAPIEPEASAPLSSSPLAPREEPVPSGLTSADLFAQTNQSNGGQQTSAPLPSQEPPPMTQPIISPFVPPDLPASNISSADLFTAKETLMPEPNPDSRHDPQGERKSEAATAKAARAPGAQSLDPAEAAGYAYGVANGTASAAAGANPSGDPSAAARERAGRSAKPAAPNTVAAAPDPLTADPAALLAQSYPGSAPSATSTYDTQLHNQTIEVLNNIDQGMGACAMNLSTLQKIAGEQTETLRVLAENMQNQNFFEIGLNLNSVIESLSAALEPMKAVGELVPAIDQLVTALESKEASDTARHEHDEAKLTPEQLVASLAEQLSTGVIDSWTFKSAYMAVYPTEHPADLLHRLVDLLGTKRLSGDIFRAAYDAVQATEPPRRLTEESVQTVVQVVQDETLLAQIEDLRKGSEELRRSNEDLIRGNEDLRRGSEELRRNNEELRRNNEELGSRTSEPQIDSAKLDEMQMIIQALQQRLHERETELSEALAAKDQELQEAHDLLNSRWEEFNARYDELTETLHKRDELIAEREAELARKESENQQLKAQMEELSDQTKNMVAGLQQQFSASAAKPKEEPARPQGSFFDPSSAAGGGQPGLQAPAQQPAALFDAGPSRPLFQPSAQMQQPMDQQIQSGQQMAAPQPQQAQMVPPQPAPAPQSSNQAIPRPAPTTAPFLSGAGSYGSGVRAQVFEVIVRQALAGAPWREICAGPMSVNNITAEEVETEVKRRQALLGKK